MVIIGEETNVKIDGTILYLSSGNAEPAGRDEAQVHYDIEDPQAQPVAPAAPKAKKSSKEKK